MSDINWGLLNTNRDTNTEFNDAAQQGVARQVAVGGLNALQGVDLTDPQSLQNAMNNSARSGNIPQVNALALAALTAQRYKYTQQEVAREQQSQPQATQPALSALQPGQVAEQTAIADPTNTFNSSDYPAGTVNYNGQPVNQQAALDHADKISQEIENAKAITDPAERLAYAQKIAPDLHIDPSKVTLENTTPTELERMKGVLAAHKDVLQGNVENVVPEEPDTPDLQYAHTMAILSQDPEKMTNYYKLVHPELEKTDLPGVMYDPIAKRTIRVNSSQDISAQAAQTAGASKGAEITAQNQNELVTPFLNGSATPLPQMTRADIARYNSDPVNQANGHFLTTEANPAVKAGAVTGATKKAENENTIGEIGVYDEATGQERKYNGTVSDLIKDMKSGDITKDSNGRYVVGKQPTAQEVATTAADTDLMGKMRAEATDQDKYNQKQAQIDNGKTAIAQLNSLKTDSVTPSAEKLANVLNVLGVKAGTKEATDIATYKNLIGNNMMSYIHQFPGRFTDRDAKISSDASAGLTTVSDTAKFAFAKKTAEIQKSKDFDDYVVQNPNMKSAKAAAQAFNTGEGQYSLYAQPIFQQTNIKNNGGFPIVTPFPAEKDGSQYGLLRLNKDKNTWQSIRLK